MDVKVAGFHQHPNTAGQGSTSQLVDLTKAGGQRMLESKQTRYRRFDMPGAHDTLYKRRFLIGPYLHSPVYLGATTRIGRGLLQHRKHKRAQNMRCEGASGQTV